MGTRQPDTRPSPNLLDFPSLGVTSQHRGLCEPLNRCRVQNNPAVLRICSLAVPAGTSSPGTASSGRAFWLCPQGSAITQPATKPSSLCFPPPAKVAPPGAGGCSPAWLPRCSIHCHSTGMFLVLFVIFPPVRQQKSGQAGRRRRRQGAISGSCCYLLHVNPQLVGGRFSLNAFLGGHILNIEKQSEEEED